MIARCAACYFLIFHMGMRFEVIPWSYFAGWVAMCLFEIPYLVRIMRTRRTQPVIKEEL